MSLSAIRSLLIICCEDLSEDISRTITFWQAVSKELHRLGTYQMIKCDGEGTVQTDSATFHRNLLCKVNYCF